MDLSNLHTGDVIKNYRYLCDILKEPYRNGGSGKKSQLKMFNKYFDWEKQGQKFIIKEIYDTPIKKIHPLNNLGHYKIGNEETYCIDKKFNQSKGVYKIQLGSDIYIGSTIRCFRHRYTQHYKNSDNMMPHTQKMLLSGGKYMILWLAPENATENEIRKMEQFYIDKYTEDENYNVINHTLKVDIPEFRKKKNIIRNRRILVNEKDYKKLIRLCKENKIDVL